MLRALDDPPHALPVLDRARRGFLRWAACRASEVLFVGVCGRRLPLRCSQPLLPLPLLHTHTVCALQAPPPSRSCTWRRRSRHKFAQVRIWWTSVSAWCRSRNLNLLSKLNLGHVAPCSARLGGSPRWQPRPGPGIIFLHYSIFCVRSRSVSLYVLILHLCNYYCIALCSVCTQFVIRVSQCERARTHARTHARITARKIHARTHTRAKNPASRAHARTHARGAGYSSCATSICTVYIYIYIYSM